LESDPIGLKGGSFSTYSYTNDSPISRIDPFGLSEQDVLNALAQLRQLYPNLVNGISVNQLPGILDSTSIGGAYIPGTNRIYIQKKFYTKQCLNEAEQQDLAQTLAHESLHIYLDNQVGTFQYLINDSANGYHTWIDATAAAIATYLHLPTQAPPSLDTYPKGPFTP
jgi:hypothetical protein